MSEFTVKVDYMTNYVDHIMAQYLPGNNGMLEYEPMKFQRGFFKFSWSPVFKMHDVESLKNKDITYKLVYTTNPNVNLD